MKSIRTLRLEVLEDRAAPAAVPVSPLPLLLPPPGGGALTTPLGPAPISTTPDLLPGSGLLSPSGGTLPDVPNQLLAPVGTPTRL